MCWYNSREANYRGSTERKGNTQITDNIWKYIKRNDDDASSSSSNFYSSSSASSTSSSSSSISNW